MKVKVDRDLCIGAANCVGIAPSVFQLDDEQRATVLDPSTVAEETLWEAAETCPTNAIILEDDEGKHLYP